MESRSLKSWGQYRERAADRAVREHTISTNAGTVDQLSIDTCRYILFQRYTQAYHVAQCMALDIYTCTPPQYSTSLTLARFLRASVNEINRGARALAEEHSACFRKPASDWPSTSFAQQTKGDYLFHPDPVIAHGALIDPSANARAVCLRGISSAKVRALVATTGTRIDRCAAMLRDAALNAHIDITPMDDFVRPRYPTTFGGMIEVADEISTELQHIHAVIQHDLRERRQARAGWKE